MKFYYLRKEIDEFGYNNDRAIYKHHDFSRFYRGDFYGIEVKYQGMKIYKCKTLKKIKEIQKSTYEYCGEVFDIYDENGIFEKGNESKINESVNG